MSVRNALVPAALAATVALSSCSAPPGAEDEQNNSTASAPHDSSQEEISDSPQELRQGFEELSGLVLPSDAADLEIEGRLLPGDRPRYDLRFETTRGGAEVICTADNFGVQLFRRPPDEDQREPFDVQESDDEIAETVVCRGGNPENPRVQRQVLVLFPEDGFQNEDGEPDGNDHAVVYAYSVLWPND